MTEDDIGFRTGHGGLTARSPDQDSKSRFLLRDVTNAPGLRAAGTALRPPAPRPPRPLVRVLLCEDQEIFRLGLRVVFEAQPDIAVVAETSHLTEALEVADGPGTQVVVVRQGLVGCSGLPLLRDLCQRATGVLVLAETGATRGSWTSCRPGCGASCRVARLRSDSRTPSAHSPGRRPRSTPPSAASSCAT